MADTLETVPNRSPLARGRAGTPLDGATTPAGGMGAGTNDGHDRRATRSIPIDHSSTSSRA